MCRLMNMMNRNNKQVSCLQKSMKENFRSIYLRNGGSISRLSDMRKKEECLSFNCLQHDSDHHLLLNRYDLHQKEIPMLV